jgi:hypothetical protein
MYLHADKQRCVLIKYVVNSIDPNAQEGLSFSSEVTYQFKTICLAQRSNVATSS